MNNETEQLELKFKIKRNLYEEMVTTSPVFKYHFWGDTYIKTIRVNGIVYDIYRHPKRASIRFCIIASYASGIEEGCSSGCDLVFHFWRGRKTKFKTKTQCIPKIPNKKLLCEIMKSIAIEEGLLIGNE